MAYSWYNPFSWDEPKSVSNQGKLVGSANYYQPMAGPANPNNPNSPYGRSGVYAGNTVSDYVNGKKAVAGAVFDSGVPVDQTSSLSDAGVADDGTGTSGTGSGTAETPFGQWFDGQWFDNQTSLLNAIIAKANQQFEAANQEIQKAYSYQLISAQQRDELINKNYSTAMQNISGRYSALSPDAYQSSQTTQEYGAGDERNLNTANNALYKTQLQDEYSNKLASNQSTYQNQIDTTVNNNLDTLAPGSYANNLSLQAPTLSNNAGTAYQGAAQTVAGGGNTVAVKAKIDQMDVDPSIKTFLYGRFGITA